MDICSKDPELVKYFEKENGPVDESIYQFYTRSYNRLCDRVASPEKFQYNQEDFRLHCESFRFEAISYQVNVRNQLLQAIQLKSSHSSTAANNLGMVEMKICIMYFHTNLRSLIDSAEVLSLARIINAHVVAFDLPGCGKSEGKLCGDLDQDFEAMLDWARQQLYSNNVKFIIWARGMSTAPAIALLSRLSTTRSSRLASTVMCVILDSPFTSIKDIVHDCLKHMHGAGFSLTKAIINFLISRMLSHLSQRLDGFNLYSLAPIDLVSTIYYPVCILSAGEDDYVSIDMGHKIARAWGGPRRIRSDFRVFTGSHFEPRSEHVIMMAKDFIRDIIHEMQPVAVEEFKDDDVAVAPGGNDSTAAAAVATAETNPITAASFRRNISFGSLRTINPLQAMAVQIQVRRSRSGNNLATTAEGEGK